MSPWSKEALKKTSPEWRVDGGRWSDCAHLGSQGFPLDVLETKTLMWGGSTRIMEAEGTCMISARRFTISCHFRMISKGTSIECATLELRSCGSEAVLSR